MTTTTTVVELPEAWPDACGGADGGPDCRALPDIAIADKGTFPGIEIPPEGIDDDVLTPFLRGDPGKS